VPRGALFDSCSCFGRSVLAGQHYGIQYRLNSRFRACSRHARFSIALALRGQLAAKTTIIYVGAQVLGGILGVFAARLVFELSLWQVSVTARVAGRPIVRGGRATGSSAAVFNLISQA
jgi:hypothetical protein